MSQGRVHHGCHLRLLLAGKRPTGDGRFSTQRGRLRFLQGFAMISYADVLSWSKYPYPSCYSNGGIASTRNR